MSIDFFDEFATDAAAELNGVEVPYKGTTFIVARAGNKKYGKLLSELVKKHQIALDLKDDAADELSDRLMAEVLSKTILVGWKGEITYKGEKLKYSTANAAKLLAHADFRAQVSRWADDREAFRVKAQEEKVGN